MLEIRAASGEFAVAASVQRSAARRGPRPEISPIDQVSGAPAVGSTSTRTANSLVPPLVLALGLAACTPSTTPGSPSRRRGSIQARIPPPRRGGATPAEGLTWREATQRFQAAFFGKTLADCDGSVPQEARRLDLARSAVYAMIDRFDVDDHRGPPRSPTPVSADPESDD